MNILIIGSGAREHAIANSLLQSTEEKKIFVLPGNAGTANKCVNLDLEMENFASVAIAIKKHNINLLIIGPETPLINGLTDFLKKDPEALKFFQDSESPPDQQMLFYYRSRIQWNSLFFLLFLFL